MMIYKVTFKTNRGDFTKEYEGYFGREVGERCFVQSPFYKKRGTYRIVKIEVIKED